MYKTPVKIPSIAPPKPQFTPENNLKGGLDLLDKEWRIGKNKTSNVKNMWFNDGELGKRYGQRYLGDEDTTIWDDTDIWTDATLWDDTRYWTDSLETPTYTVYKKLFKGYIIKHCGFSIYRQNVTTGVIEAVHNSLTAGYGNFFEFNSKLYYMQTNNFIVWDGALASDVVPYIPTIYKGMSPATGVGTRNEYDNAIGAGFKNSFSGTGAATSYQLSKTDLDATTITVLVGVTAVVEGTGFTVNRTTGVVNFATGTAPYGAPASGTDNVVITAYKTDAVARNKILSCLHSETFGGRNDTRVFVGGNGTGSYFWSGIAEITGADATYFPDNNYNVIGDYGKNITGFGEQYETLCIFKEKEIYGCNYSWNGTVGIFESFPISKTIGCDCPYTIININNNLTWLDSSNGGYTLVGSAVESQRNIFPITRNIDKWLLEESNLTSACVADYKGKYWLCVNDKVYLWDYFLSPYNPNDNPLDVAEALSWWYFTNINAHSFVVDGTDLYYVNRTTSKGVAFQTTLNDFGSGIEGIYRIPMRDLGSGVYTFDVFKTFLDVRGDTKTTLTVTYYTSDDLGGIVDSETFTVGSFSLLNFSLDNFTLDVMSIKTTFTLTPNEKDIDLFGIEFSNDVAGRDLNISNAIIQYKLRKEKR